MSSGAESSEESSEDEFDFDLPPPAAPPPPPEEPTWSHEEASQEFAPSSTAAAETTDNTSDMLPLKTSTRTKRRTKTRRRSSVMELVGQFKRGSFAEEDAAKKREEEARKITQEELAQLAPSTSPRYSTNASGSPTEAGAGVDTGETHHQSGAGQDTFNTAPGMRNTNTAYMMGGSTATSGNIETEKETRRRSYAPAESPWKQMRDPSTGHSYWWNSKTQESSWTDPNTTASTTPTTSTTSTTPTAATHTAPTSSASD